MDSDTRRELKKIKREVEHLRDQLQGPSDENRVDEIDRQVERIDKFLIYRYQEQYFEPVERIVQQYRNGTDWYSGIPDEDIKLQLRLDQIIMNRAENRDDMLTFCIRAFQQVECMLSYFVRALWRENLIEDAWEPFTHDAPSSLSQVESVTQSAYFSKHVVLFEVRGYLRDKDFVKHEPNESDKEAHWASITFGNLRNIRNWSVHRSGKEPPLDLDTDELNEHQRAHFTGDREEYRGRIRRDLQFLANEITSHPALANSSSGD